MRTILFGMILCVAHSTFTMDGEHSILEAILEQVRPILADPNRAEPLAAGDCETLAWLAWDGNELAKYWVMKLMEKDSKKGYIRDEKIYG